MVNGDQLGYLTKIVFTQAASSGVSTSASAMLPAVITTVLWSCSAIYAAKSASIIGPQRANLARIALATVFLGIWAHTFGKGFEGPALSWFLLSGLIGFGFGDLALFGALPRIGPRLAILLTHCIAAPLAAMTEWAWLGTTLGWREILCAMVILSGVAVALAPDRGVFVKRSTFWIGVIFGIGSAIGQGLGSVISTKAAQVAELANYPIDGGTAAYQRIVAGLALTVVVIFLLPKKAEGALASGAYKKAWPYILANTLAGPALGVACYQWALMDGKTGVVMPIVATSPVVTLLLVWWMDGVRPTKRSTLGGIAAVCGVIALRLTQTH